MNVGTAAAAPGERGRGYLPVAELPTGGDERLPVAIVNGVDPGPTLFVSGSAHSGEVTGLAVAQDVVDGTDPGDLAGQLLSLPNLNPSGLRRAGLTAEGRHSYRTSYYHNDNPNSYYPTHRDVPVDKPGISKRRRVQELMAERVHEVFAEHADAMVDLHTAQAGWMPWTIVARQPYGVARTEAEAREMVDEQVRLAEAVGLPIAYTGSVEEGLNAGDDRTITGCGRRYEGIPGIVLELGGHSFVEEGPRAAGVVGLANVMRELDMLPGDPVANEHAPADPVDYRVRYTATPHADEPGIARYRVDAGDTVAAGDPIADVVAPHGERRTTVTSDHDGYVLGRYEGVARYRNDALACLAIRDDLPVVQRHPLADAGDDIRGDD
jgi:predicted deacylase